MKKIKKMGMNALLDVAQGSVRPARVMILNGMETRTQKPHQ